MWKRIILLSIASVMVLMSGFSSVMGQEKPFAGQTINALLIGGVEYEALWKKATQDFEQETGMKVNYSTLIFEDLMTKESMLGAAKDSSYDVYHTHFAQIASFRHFFEPLEEYLAVKDWRDFFSAGIDPVTFDGHIMMLPRYFDARLLYYNTEMFQKAGLSRPPTNWQELVDFGQKLTDAPKQYGYVTCGRGDPVLRCYSDFLWQAGGEFLDTDMKPIFNNPAGVEALQFMVDLIHKYKIVPPGTPSFGWEDMTNMFTQGRVAINYEWPGLLEVYNDPEKSRIVGKFAFAAIPGYRTNKTTAVCHGSAINRYSKKKRLAWEFISWLNSTKTLVEEYKFRGIIPSRRSALKQILAEAKGEELARMQAYLKTVEEGGAWPKIPEWSQISKVIWDELTKALIKEKTPEQALDYAAEKTEEILEEAGYYK